MANQSDADREAAAKVNEEVRKADDERRKAAAEEAKKSAEEARQSAEETLAEQGGMKPEPSQEEADLIKVGASDPAKRKGEQQPEGPASRAAQGQPDRLTRSLEGAKGGEYETRSAAPAPRPQPPKQQPS
jgi:hypothetical protein